MNQQLITILVFAFLVFFIFSPFAALAGLMLMLLFTSLFFLVTNLLRVLISGTNN
ncbi:hypothetical protein NOS3756_15470 [Nostoc sp. NIES-3756]|jgi:hypothetical protein|nr:hypothetical protein NOS3756_15470 [Nostoc sp. NIES-3756]BAY39704.1 hypothetical protein NIES2111_40810 [Nostoc sp. NIES-2111]